MGSSSSPADGPSEGDEGNIQSQVTADADWLVLKLAGERFIDNGDGTVTDTQTRLMWEQKTGVVGSDVLCTALGDCPDPHDVTNRYPWTNNVTVATGYLFTNFLRRLNGADDGVCFAGHCDWRVPTIEELQTILLEPYPCGTSPCIDPIFGPTHSYYYWSATTYASDTSTAWGVNFNDGNVGNVPKLNSYRARAVRSGL